MLNLTKPLAFFDLETTGTNVATDRIVEIAVVKVMPNQEVSTKSSRINPTIPIPLESSMIHGIYDQDVAGSPTFAEVAHTFAQFLQGCDLAGFNHIKFDIPLLMEEFNRVSVDFDINNRKLVDAQKIFHMMEPRTLTAAYKFYCMKELEGAHNAEKDTMATYEVLKAQVIKYEGRKIKDSKGNESEPVKNDMAVLHALSFDKLVDLAGRMVFNDKREEVFNFGKYKGQKVDDVFKKDSGYYDWMMQGDFPIDTKKKITEIKLRGFNKK
jgi:DNA polymerase III subunit epsilon